MSEFTSDSSHTLNLLRRARGGDRAAFDALFERHCDAFKRFVSLRFDARMGTRMDASDIVQETQFEAFRRFNDFYDRRPMPFDVWLRKNAYDRLRNARRDHVKTQKRSVDRENRMPDQSSILIARTLHARSPTPSECASQNEYRERVSQTVDELDERDRELLLMRVVEGRSHQEIAQLLEIDERAARQVKSQILATAPS